MRTYAVTIGGTSKTIQTGWTITETANGRNRFDFSVLSRTGTYRPALDDEVILTEDGTRIFGGLIDRPQESSVPNALSKVDLWLPTSAVDYNVYPSRIAITSDTDRPAESLAARLTWIAGLMSAQGVTLSGSQATGPTLGAQTFVSGRYLNDVLDDTTAVASGTGATSWTWNVDYSKVLSAVEAGTVAAPFNVADGDGHVVGDITVEQPRSSTYGNYIILLGGTGSRDVSDSWTSTGSATFTLTYPLLTSYGYVTCGGIFETLGTGATWTYDGATNSITRAAGAPGVGVSVVMTYIAQFPLRVVADGGASAANRVVRTYQAADVFDATVMQALANSFLTRDMASPKTVRYNAAYSLTGIHPGQTQTITSSKRNLSGTFLITEVRIVNTGKLVQRQVTAVSSTRLPATLRESFQQAFGGGGSQAISVTATDAVKLDLSNVPHAAVRAGTEWAASGDPTKIDGANIYAGTVSVSKFLTVGGGGCLTDDPDLLDVTAWSQGTGFNLYDVGVNGIAGRYGGYSTVGTGEVWVLGQRRVAIDPNKTYRFHIWVYNDGANGSFYAGVSLRDGTGAEIAGDGSYWYYCAGAYVPTNGAWTEVHGVFGAGTTDSGLTGGLKASKGAIPSNAKTMAIQFGLNASGSAGYYAVQDPRIEEMAPSTLIQDGAITTDKLVANAVTAAKIAAHTITANEIAATTITATEIAGSTITGAKIAASTITGSNIAATTIAAGNIVANTITSAQIAANTITASQIAANTITASQIAAHTITTNELSVSTLSAITADLGSVTAGQIVVGSTDKLWFNDGGDGMISAGGSTKGSANFKLYANGNVYVNQITADSAILGQPGTLSSISINGGMSFDGTNGWLGFQAFAGGGNRALMVDNGGIVYAA